MTENMPPRDYSQTAVQTGFGLMYRYYLYQFWGGMALGLLTLIFVFAKVLLVIGFIALIVFTVWKIRRDRRVWPNGKPPRG